MFLEEGISFKIPATQTPEVFDPDEPSQLKLEDSQISDLVFGRGFCLRIQFSPPAFLVTLPFFHRLSVTWLDLHPLSAPSSE